MKTDIERQDASTYRIDVEIPAEDVDAKLDAVYKRIVQEIEVPGFRKGHVPRSYLEMRFGSDFLYEDAQQELIEEALPEALESHDLRPASRPELKDVEFEAGQPFRFRVEVEVFPEVELPADIASIDVDVPEPDEISEDDLQDMIEDMRFQHATLVPKDDAQAIVEDEDVVTVVTSGGQSKELQAQAEGSTEALIGHHVGEEVTLSTRDEESVTVTVDAINDIELPDLEDLAATVGYDDAEAMRESIRDDLRQRTAQQHEKQVHTAILDALVDASDVDVPTGVVEESVDQEIQHFQEQGHQPTDEQKAELREQIEQRLKRERVLNAFKRREGIELSDADFDNYLEEKAAEYDMPVVKFRALLEREEQLEHFRHERENRLALDRLTEMLGLSETIQTPTDDDTEEDSDDGE